MVDDFEKGYIEYRVENELKEEILLNDWNDGYIALSNQEMRLKDALSLFDTDKLSELLNRHFSPSSGIEGYIVEINLWRNNGKTFEELSIEREDQGFLIQYWKLSKTEFENSIPCYFREVQTLPRENSIFRTLSTIEVIVPNFRLHFFITKQGG